MQHRRLTRDRSVKFSRMVAPEVIESVYCLLTYLRLSSLLGHRPLITVLQSSVPGFIDPRDEDPSSPRRVFSVNSVINISVTSRFFTMWGLLSTRSTLLLSHPGLGPTKGELHDDDMCTLNLLSWELGFHVKG